MSRRWALVLVVVSLVAVACKSTGGPGSGPEEPPRTPVKGFPSSMVALGDSITAAYGSCLAPTSCPRNSWSTGDGTQVNSHYRRIVKANPAMEDHARNLAVPGALVADLPGQATAAARQPAEYVTILIGANDACRGEMTSPADFRAKLDQTLATLKRAMPTARLLLVSIPNVFRVWEIGHTNRVALAAWKSGICPNLLTNPTSNAAPDVARRLAFKNRIEAFNTQIAGACGAYGSKCRHDSIATFAFELAMLSAIDFFHPNAAGQTTLAAQTYPGTFTW